MRRMGFYISDFSYDMNSTDFELLCKSGNISIINYNEYVKSNCEDKEQSKMTKIQDCHNHKEGLAPWIDEFSEILILGSLPSDVSIKEQAYYQNKSKNSFWKLMHDLLGQGDDSKEFLLKNILLCGIVLLRAIEREAWTPILLEARYRINFQNF